LHHFCGGFAGYLTGQYFIFGQVEDLSINPTSTKFKGTVQQF